ncbi:MAG: LCP family protein [Eubacterium sp.]|nr:LCP family protein [Eubacterium sp.]
MSDRTENPNGFDDRSEDESSLFDTDEISASDRLRIMSATGNNKSLDDLEYFSVQSDRHEEGHRQGSRSTAQSRDSHRRNLHVSTSRRRMSRRSKIKLIIMFIVLALLTVLLVFALMISHTLSKMNRVARSPQDIIDAAHETFDRDTDAADTISDTDLDLDDIVAMKDHDIKNILLIGQDLRADEEQSRARSDTMILCSLNTETNEIYLTSLMRDMYVEIPGYSNNKLNAAYFFGGMELLDETIKKNFGITIDANMVVDFEGFMETMTTIGDLNLQLTAEEAQYINSHNYYGSTEDQWQFDQDWTLHEGMNTMTPSQVLAYSRIRYVGNSDYERTERQRKVLMAAFEKIKGGSLKQMLSLANKVFPYFTTDMDNAEFLGYVKTIVQNDMTDVQSTRIPQEETYTGEIINGMDVLYADLEANSKYLQEFITK